MTDRPRYVGRTDGKPFDPADFKVTNVRVIPLPAVDGGLETINAVMARLAPTVERERRARQAAELAAARLFYGADAKAVRVAPED